MIRITLSMLLLFGLLVTPCMAEEDEELADLEYVEEDSATGTSVNWTQQVLTVVGNGFGPEHVKELGRRKILAKRAALQDAYRNLLEVVKGIQLTSSTSVKDMMLESDQIRTQTEGMLKGMKTKSISYSNDGGCEVTVEVNIDQNGGYLLGALSNMDIQVQDNYPKFDWVALREELESVKGDLAEKKVRLEQTEQKLASTRYTLSRTAGELKEVKSQFAVVKADFDKNLKELWAANEKLIRSEEELKYSKLREEDAQNILAQTKGELDKTRTAVDELNRTLHRQDIENAVNSKELAMTRQFLDEKKADADRLYASLSSFQQEHAAVSVDRAKLAGYVERVREIQYDTGRHMQQYYSSTNHAAADTTEPTGILIDARGMSLKPALAPCLLTEQKEMLYGVGCSVKPEGNGPLVDYLSGDLNRAKQYNLIGNDPLVIQAVASEKGSDLVLSAGDVRRLAPYTDLLRQRKVVILL